jgi:hypothetical protein
MASGETTEIHATGTAQGPGRLTRIVHEWTQRLESRAVATELPAEEWDALAEFVATDRFVRVGAYQEVMRWDEYIKFLRKWAGTTRFESTQFRVSEIGRVVIQEIEERHFHGDDFILKNVIAVYEFDENDRLCHLDIYEQAKDTGRWIAEAAREAAGAADPEYAAAPAG